MLIYSGKNISGKRVVAKIQKMSPMARYCNPCGERPSEDIRKLKRR